MFLVEETRRGKLKNDEMEAHYATWGQGGKNQSHFRKRRASGAKAGKCCMQRVWRIWRSQKIAVHCVLCALTSSRARVRPFYVRYFGRSDPIGSDASRSTGSIDLSIFSMRQEGCVPDLIETPDKFLIFSIVEKILVNLSVSECVCVCVCVLTKKMEGREEVLAHNFWLLERTKGCRIMTTSALPSWKALIKRTMEIF